MNSIVVGACCAGGRKQISATGRIERPPGRRTSGSTRTRPLFRRPAAKPLSDDFGLLADLRHAESLVKHLFACRLVQ